MGGTEKIEVEGTQFRIFRRLPYRLGTAFQRLMLEAYADTDFPLNKIRDFDLEAMTARDMNRVDLEKIQEAQELLLKKAVVSPTITDEILDDYTHELQDCIEPLLAKMMEHYSDQKKTIT